MKNTLREREVEAGGARRAAHWALPRTFSPLLPPPGSRPGPQVSGRRRSGRPSRGAGRRAGLLARAAALGPRPRRVGRGWDQPASPRGPGCGAPDEQGLWWSRGKGGGAHPEVI